MMPMVTQSVRSVTLHGKLSDEDRDGTTRTHWG
jgi:hypothetical protein